jgi:hypothetical protein
MGVTIAAQVPAIEAAKGTMLAFLITHFKV